MKTQNKDLNYKLGLLKLAMELDNVSLACKIFGCSRPTYYRYKKAYLEGGEEALRDVSRKKPNPKNQVLPHKIKILLAMTKKFIIPPKILYYPTFYLLIQ